MRRIAAMAALALIVPGLAGCGRRGALEAPPGLATPQALAAQQAKAQAPASGDVISTGNLLPRHAKPTPVEVPKQSFVLDPLL